MRKVPFPPKIERNYENFVFRLVYKPETGVLWGYNEFFCKKDILHEINEAPNQHLDTIQDEFDHHPNIGTSQRNHNSSVALNSSEFLHSKLGLLDDQITINYDLSVPTLVADE